MRDEVAVDGSTSMSRETVDVSEDQRCDAMGIASHPGTAVRIAPELRAVCERAARAWREQVVPAAGPTGSVRGRGITGR